VGWNGQENFSLSCELWVGTNDFNTKKNFLVRSNPRIIFLSGTSLNGMHTLGMPQNYILHTSNVLPSTASKKGLVGLYNIAKCRSNVRTYNRSYIVKLCSTFFNSITRSAHLSTTACARF
jgi:hypothetical protein